MKYDFSGWATRNNLKCSDGRVIMRDAFKGNDGKTVPLVWNHQHNDSANVLGHAQLENRYDGVYAYCKFNDTDSGRNAKLLVDNGDITQLSIYANRLKQNGAEVLHGEIREVSLVLAGANPGAYIDSVIRHGEASEEEGVIYTGENFTLCHADNEDNEEDSNMENEETVEDVFNTLSEKQKNVVYAIIGQALEDGAAEVEHGDYDDYYFEHGDDEEETVEDVFNTLTEKQKNVVYAIIGQALEDNGGENDMKHNVFDMDDYMEDDYLTHADQEDILTMANKVGSFQDALEIYSNENDLQHDAIASGFAQENISTLFPEYHDVRPGAPELITNDQGWITTVMNKVHKSPFSRIRTGQVDIRNLDDLRAHGYQKGKYKNISGNYKLARRTTDPQTVYVKSALHRDDIVDITDFDTVQYQYNIDKTMLNEELATAIMLGDGRDEGAEDKIDPTKIRPIWTDDDLYTIHVDIDKDAVTKELQGTDANKYFGDNFITAEAMVNTVLYSREKFKGSGTPDMYITPHMLNVMLLARDRNGHRIYSSKAELATALNVGAIHTVEQFEGKIRTDTNMQKHKLVALIVNLSDYSLGATKGGQVSHFTQFDIDFNQQKSLLETRCSGALTRLWSAIAIEEKTV